MKAIIEIGKVGVTQPVYCWVNGETLRGRHVESNLTKTGLRPIGGLEQIDSWPGMYVMLDDKARVCKIYYPLVRDTREFNEFKELCKNAGMPGFESPQEFEYTELSDEEIKEWAFWMNRIVDEGDAKLREGTIPKAVPLRILRIRKQQDYYSDPLNMFKEERALESPGMDTESKAVAAK